MATQPVVLSRPSVIMRLGMSWKPVCLALICASFACTFRGAFALPVEDGLSSDPVLEVLSQESQIGNRVFAPGTSWHHTEVISDCVAGLSFMLRDFRFATFTHSLESSVESVRRNNSSVRATAPPPPLLILSADTDTSRAGGTHRLASRLRSSVAYRTFGMSCRQCGGKPRVGNCLRGGLRCG